MEKIQDFVELGSGTFLLVWRCQSEALLSEELQEDFVPLNNKTFKVTEVVYSLVQAKNKHWLHGLGNKITFGSFGKNIYVPFLLQGGGRSDSHPGF